MTALALMSWLQTLPLPYGSVKGMTAAFTQAHQQRFGFVPENAALMIDILTAVAIGATGEKVSLRDTTGAGSPAQSAWMWSGGSWRDVRLVDRTALARGERVNGPTILTEPTGTNIVEDGGQAECAAGGNLVLRRVIPLAWHEAIGTQVDR